MKCLEKDRDRRYETASALAADIQRCLASEAVLACPSSASYLGYDVKVADVITAAFPFVEKSFEDEPLIEARLRMTLGQSFVCLGYDTTAVRQFETARRLYTKHLGADHPDTLRSMNNLANSYADVGRY